VIDDARSGLASGMNPHPSKCYRVSLKGWGCVVRCVCVCVCVCVCRHWEEWRILGAGRGVRTRITTPS